MAELRIRMAKFFSVVMLSISGWSRHPVCLFELVEQHKNLPIASQAWVAFPWPVYNRASRAISPVIPVAQLNSVMSRLDRNLV